MHQRRTAHGHGLAAAAPLLAAALLAATALFAEPALAHVGAGAHGHGNALGGSFLGGFAHLFGGLDHLLAMVAVGLWAAQLGGRALWALPLAFVGMMALGALAVVAIPQLPATEFLIAGSVLLLGLAVAARLHLPAVLAAAVVAPFALAHGYAHGAEMAPGGAAALYGLGFVLATALLHAGGVLAILGLDRAKAPALLARGGGAAIALAGVAMLGGLGF